MAQRKKITIRSVQALKPGEEVWDSEVVGFTARRRTGGVSFCVVYRTQGRRRRYTIGKLGALTPDVARAEARRLLGDVALGLDPQGDKHNQRDAITMNELFDLYLEEERAWRILGRRGEPKKASTVYNDAGAIRAHLGPLLGDIKARDVDRRAVERTMHAIAEGKTARLVKGRPRGLARIAGGRGAASRVIGLLGAIMNFAVERGLIETNPCSRLRRFAGNPRTRRLSDDEFAALAGGFKNALDDGSWPPAVNALRLLALTGWRSGEALALRWRDVDLVRRTAFLPDTKTGRSMRPLSNAALDVLRSIQRTGDSDLVFPASRGSGPMGGFKRQARAIITAAGLPTDITPHTLRHSFISVAAELGLSDPTIGALVGHKGRSVTSRYTHFADAPLLAAADLVARKIISLIGDTKSDSKVIELRPSVNQIC